MPANSPNLLKTSSISSSDEKSSESALDFDVSSSSCDASSLICDESEERDGGGRGFTSAKS